jgi:AraC-like DNA-binding protein
MGFSPVLVSTSSLDEHDRVPVWREVIARMMLRVDLTPLSDQPFEAKAALRALPGLRMMHYAGSEFRMQRTKGIVANSDDGFGIVVNLDGFATISQFGREVTLGRGDATAICNTGPATYAHKGSRHVGLIVPRSALAPIANLQDAAARLIPHSNEALRLLVGCVRELLHKKLTLMNPDLLHLSIAHVHDLLALVLQVTGDRAALAERRGLRAARLQGIKNDILNNIGREELNISDVARRQRVTPRYIQKLFEREGTTFTEFVLMLRLARACQMLKNPRFSDWTIAAIAYEAGFGDLSYFNRTFRHRYGFTPSDVRASAWCQHEFCSTALSAAQRLP